MADDKQSENFYRIENESTIFEDLVKVAFDERKFKSYFHFNVKVVHHSVVIKDPFLTALLEVHPFIAGVLLIKPNSIYNWHIDDDRGSSLNMFLSGGKSHCLFTDEASEMVSKFEELYYEPKHYYLLNTQSTHCVVNFESPRLIFSLQFKDDKTKLSYEQLLSEIKRGDYDSTDRSPSDLLWHSQSEQAPRSRP